MPEKISLYGFNNLTKSLSFNIYDVCYAASKQEKADYTAYIDEQYNSDRLTAILMKVSEMIGAHVLNLSKQDYEPLGASVNVLIAEDELEPHLVDSSNNLGNLDKRNTIHAHLDKSHLTVHTFPESHPNKDISTFRVDIDVATCGRVSPLNALDYLISQFESDIMTLDYRVRGFTRDQDGKKIFIDHDISSIQDYIDDQTLDAYDATDINVYQANLYHTKMKIKDIDLPHYLFNQDYEQLSAEKKQSIYKSLKKEMIEIYSGMNIYD
ncbi:MAG: adenosylmethionine decarboxylase [Clostridiaceae bacterium]|nr:adenosylmethionine decarboxylase [Bacillota bacterium]NLN51453.1 adenosylmethionine decarboxylase [Clostridiaceae bacterium]